MSEPNRKIIVDGVDFREIFYFPRIFRAVINALQPSRMMIALVMVLLLVTLGSAWDGMTGQGAFAGATSSAAMAFAAMTGGLFALSPMTIISGAQALIELPMEMWNDYKAFTIIYGLLFVLITAVGGGAIARMSAVHTATNRRMSVREAVQYAFTRWLRLFSAPLMPILAAAVLALLIVLMGVLMLVPVLNILGGMLYIFALLLGLLIAFLMLVYALAFVMVVPALVTEDCDGADGQQRAYGYVLSRPLHMAGYLLLAIIGLALGFFVVSLFGNTVLNLTPGLFATFQGEEVSAAFAVTENVSVFGAPAITAEEADAAWHEATAGWFMNLWQTLVISIVWAYVVSYFFSAATQVYLLMRRTCDGQDMEEIWQAE